MPTGIQEILALLIVAAVVAAVIFRRWRQAERKTSSCGGCDNPSTEDKTESPVRFYRREQ
jgi:hypothetical protein